jgi:molybdopterin-guanine dinucleotide biosynthesis protein A
LISEKTKNATVARFSAFDEITDFFKKQMKAAIPPLKGLVLAGGKSQRMRYDKGLLNYHGKPQREHMGDIISQFCRETYLSCRFDQVDALAAEYPPLFDTFFDLGPMGALLSAFRSNPNAAWLVAACDLPFLDEKTVNYLVENRNPSAIATAFQSPENEFPEPLIAIWEPKAYPVLFQFLSQGISCPRKVLINSRVHLLEAPEPVALKNVNTPEEFNEAIKLLGS